MDSAYIQRASLDPDPKHDVKFTNLSNQQMYPGELFSFYGAQAAAAQPMPFSNDDMQVPQQDSLMWALSESVNNVSQMPRTNKHEMFFRENTKSGRVEFRTVSQRIWNVPFDQTEMRATDMW